MANTSSYQGMRAAVVVPSVVFCVGLLLFVLALSTPWWVETDILSIGLWRACSRTGFKYEWTCYRINRDVAEHLIAKGKAVRVMMAIGMVAQCASATTFVLTMLDKLKLLIAGASTLFTGLFTLIAVALFGSHNLYQNDPYHFGWSFILACVSCALDFAVGFAAVMIGVFWKKRQQ